jgi:choline-sulfatase
MAEVTTRRDFGKQIATLPAALTLGRQGSREQPGANRPNIVFVCSDQHSFSYTGYAGHPVVKTPNLDRIARQGVVFSNAYTGHPVCAPGRACMMTGMFASDCNSFCNSTVWDGSHPLWSLRLKNQGYYCEAIGKLDLNGRFDLGFDHFEEENDHQRNPDITSLFRRPTAYRVGERESIDGTRREKRHEDAQRTARALRFLKEQAPRLGRPWLLYLGFTEPHPKFIGLSHYYGMYEAGDIPMPDVPAAHLEGLHLVYQELRHFKRIATPIAAERIRRARIGYFAMISELDEYIGQVWDQLERSGQLANTLFVYTSDHGESLGEHGLWLKNNLYEGAVHVPLLVAGPGLPAGLRVEQPVGHVDLVSTLCEVAKAPAPGLRGHSLLPFQSVDAGAHPGYVYSECHSEGNCTGSFMIRKGDWKYVHFSWYDDLLFNLRNDPSEMRNLSGKAEFAGVERDLKQILYSLLDPEEVTLRAFGKQERMLEDMANRLSEDELFSVFKSRLGAGQARVLAAKLKRPNKITAAR